MSGGEQRELEEILESWLTLQSTKDEVESLKDFADILNESHRNGLSQLNEASDNDDDDPESVFLRSSSKLRAQQWTLSQLQLSVRATRLRCRVAEDLDWLAFYLFNRRYGWPDLEEADGHLVVTRPEFHGRSRRSSRRSELRHKQSLIESLDCIIGWLLQQEVTCLSVRMFASAVRLAESSPVTRLQLAARSLDWLKQRLRRPDEATFQAVSELAALCCADFWSEVRAAAVGRVGGIAESLSLLQIQLLFEEMGRLCDQFGNSWQAIEGGIAAINAIVKRFRKDGFATDCSIGGSGLSPRMHALIRIGHHKLEKMPQYVLLKTKALAYQLIGQEQVTTRELAVKAFVSCLSCCGEQETDLAFREVFQKLSSCAGDDAMSTPILSDSFEFMEAYCAESLLQLFLLLFKQLPHQQHCVHNWQQYHLVLDVYLMHPASSVRCASSSMYRQAAAAAVGSPQLVKAMLHSLLWKWTPNQSVLLQPLLKASSSAKERSRPSTGDQQRSFKCASETWEWREGRLLVSELVCRMLLRNHRLSTAAQLQAEAAAREKRRKSQVVGNLGRSRLSTVTEGDTLHEEFLSIREKMLLSRRSSHSEYPAVGGAGTLQLRRKTMFRLDEDAKNRLPPPSLNQQQPHPNQHSSSCSFLEQVNRIDSPTSPLPSPQSDTHSGEKQQLPSFRSLLCHMLHLCCESAADSSRWELRRMGRQALTSVGQLLLAYDAALFERTVSTHLRCEPSAMTVCALSLVRDAVGEQQQQPMPVPDTWVASCRYYAGRMPLQSASLLAFDILLLVGDCSEAVPLCLEAVDEAVGVGRGSDLAIDVSLVSSRSEAVNAVEFLQLLLELSAQHLLQFSRSCRQLSIACRLLPPTARWLLIGCAPDAERSLIGCLSCLSERLAEVEPHSADWAAAGDVVAETLSLLAHQVTAASCRIRCRRHFIAALHRVLPLAERHPDCAVHLQQLVAAVTERLLLLKSESCESDAIVQQQQQQQHLAKRNSVESNGTDLLRQSVELQHQQQQQQQLELHSSRSSFALDCAASSSESDNGDDDSIAPSEKSTLNEPDSENSDWDSTSSSSSSSNNNNNNNNNNNSSSITNNTNAQLASALEELLHCLQQCAEHSLELRLSSLPAADSRRLRRMSEGQSIRQLDTAL